MTDDIAIHLHGLTKRYGSVAALDGFELDVPAGRIVALLGPSGCGKTTALRVVAGFEVPDAGSVRIGGRPVASPGVWVPPEKRRVGMVFQDYALFPHMSVGHNVGYGLAGREAGRVPAVLELVGLAGYETRLPHELSGGEQQRVALARALAPGPQVVLLDEPFSNLDAPQRERLRREVRAILREAGTTAVFVTHDQEEALGVADVVAVMRAGRVVQVGDPVDVYRHPVDAWVAAFLGDSVVVPGRAEIGRVVTPLGSFPQFGSARGEVTVMVRPEWIRPVRDGEGGAVVVDREFYGHDQVVVLELGDGRRLRSRIGPNPIFEPGERVALEVEEIVVFDPDPDVNPAVPPDPGPARGG